MGTKKKKKKETVNEPIPFVYAGRDGRFHMVDTAMEILRSSTEPVALVSVCGRLHRDNTFLLNQFIGRSDVLTADSCSAGLWLWSSSPLQRIASDGTTYNVFFLYTRVLDEYEYLRTSCIQTVAVAVLLSSMLIYNQIGSVDDVAVHILSLVVEMSKHIQFQASQGKKKASMLEQSSPFLLLLLRDFHLGLVEDNHVITPQQHLEGSLRRVELGGNDLAATRNKMREFIRAFFPDRECCTLGPPVNDENETGHLAQIASDKLRLESIEDLATLKTFVLEKTMPKQVGDRKVTGPMLVRTTRMFIDALNSHAMPSLLQSDEEAACLRAYGFAERSFMGKIDLRGLDKVSKELLEKDLSFSLYLFDIEFGDGGSGNGALRKIYRTCLKSALEKKILELLGGAAEHVAHGSLANDKDDAALGKFLVGRGNSSSAVGSVSTQCILHCHKEVLSFGIQSRRKLDVHAQEKHMRGGRTYEDDMKFESPCHASTYDTTTGRVNNGTKMKVL